MKLMVGNVNNSSIITVMCLVLLCAISQTRAGAVLRTHVPDPTWQIGQSQLITVTLDTTASDVRSSNITSVLGKLQAPPGMTMTILDTAPVKNVPEHLTDDFFTGYEMDDLFFDANLAAGSFDDLSSRFTDFSNYGNTYGPSNRLGRIWQFSILLDDATVGQTGQFDLSDVLVFKEDDTSGLPGTTTIHDLFTVIWGGDFNGDDKVEAADLALLLDNWGQNAQPVDWTGDWDGFVDANELADLLDNWGAGLAGALLIDAPAIAIPEPATASLLVICGLAIAHRRSSY